MRLRRWWTGLRLDVVIFDQYESFPEYAYASGLGARGMGEHVIIDCNGEFVEMVVTQLEDSPEGLRWYAVDVKHWEKRHALRTVDGG